MTDRVSTLTIVLEQDMRADDAQELADAIGRMRGITHVELGTPTSCIDLVERMRIRQQMWDKLYNTIMGV